MIACCSIKKVMNNCEIIGPNLVIEAVEKIRDGLPGSLQGYPARNDSALIFMCVDIGELSTFLVKSSDKINIIPCHEHYVNVAVLQILNLCLSFVCLLGGRAIHISILSNFMVKAEWTTSEVFKGTK